MIQADVSEVDGSIFVSVPLAAALFGRRKLVTSIWRLTVEEDVRILHSLGTTSLKQMRAGLAPRVEQLVKSARHRVRDGEDASAELDILRFIAEEFPAGWIAIARLQREAGDLAEATLSVNRVLEKHPADAQAWRELVALLRQRNEHWAELNASVQMVLNAELNVGEVSEIVGRANWIMSEYASEIGFDERRIVVRSLREEFERRTAEMEATDLSKLAWLCIYDQDEDAARNWAAEGIHRDAANDHCRNLLEKLGSPR